MPTKPKSPPRIRQIANLWTLWDYPSEKRDWPLEKKITAIKEAGFDGFTALLEKDHGRLAEKHKLCTVGYFASANPA